MPFHKQGAYDGFDSFAEMRQHYRRCRHLKFFILSHKGIGTEKANCSCCGKPLTIQDGNRCEYWPTTGKLKTMHYYCSWDAIMNVVCGLPENTPVESV